MDNNEHRQSPAREEEEEHEVYAAEHPAEGQITHTANQAIEVPPPLEMNSGDEHLAPSGPVDDAKTATAVEETAIVSENALKEQPSTADGIFKVYEMGFVVVL